MAVTIYVLLRLLVTGDLCVMAGTTQPGVCRHVMKCSAVLEAALQGIPYQVCDSPENRLIVCCPWVPGQEIGLQATCQANTTITREGDNCTMLDTGRAGVCSQFANCQTAIEAAIKGQSPQICAVEGTTPFICCPLVTVAEGDQCSTATGRTGKCLRISKCPVAVETALMGKTPQICVLDGSVPVVCCEVVVEGSNCTLKHTGKIGVCRPFANCHSAQDGASMGILSQRCDLADNESELVCCTKTDRPPLPKGLFTQLPIASKAADWSNCTLNHTGKMGVCRPFANCHSAQEGASKGILPQRCDLTDNESELVCCTKIDCPPLPKGLVTQLPVGSKAADYCIKLTEKAQGDMCPLLTSDSNKLYHQTLMTTTAEAPYYGQTGIAKGGKISWIQPVSLVSDQWVLCSARAIDSSVMFVGLGGTFKPQSNHYDPDETYVVTSLRIHPLFDSRYSYVYNDIALLQLDRRVTFTARILPVCLHTGTPLPDSGFILTAWYFSSGYKTSMQRVSQEECSKAISTGLYLHPAGIKQDVEFCSRPVNTTGGCPYWYKGGPLILPNSNRVACTHLLVGLASHWYTSPCTVTNTRISAFIPWIEGIVWPESGVVV